MLKTRLLHPEILAAVGDAGHGAQMLIADGNYPLLTRSSSTAGRVCLNLTPDVVTVTDALKVLVDSILIEAAGRSRAASRTSGRCCAESSWSPTGWDFYDMARGRDVALAVSTGDQRTYANLLPTIGVRVPGADGHSAGRPSARRPVTRGEP